MDPRRKPWEEPQANSNRQHERNRAGPRSASTPRQDQQQHRKEGGRQIGGSFPTHDHRHRAKTAQQAGGHREPSHGGGGRNEHQHQHQQRDGRPQEHRGGRQNEQKAGGRNDHDTKGGQQRSFGAGGPHDQRGGGHHGHRGGGHHGHPGGGHNEQGGGGHHEHHGGGHHERRGGAHNEHRGGAHQGYVDRQRRENQNREERGNHREQPERPRRDRENGREQQVRRLGYKSLEELLEKEPSEVVITLASHPGLREMMLATEMRPDLLELLCKALCRACTARLERQSIQHLLGIVKSSEYIRACLPRYIVGMMTEPAHEKRLRYPDSLNNIISLLQQIISIFPASSIRETSMLVALIPNSINSLRASGIEVEEHIEQDLERVSNIIQDLQVRRREGTLRVDSHIVIGSEDPDEDFRTISVYPTFEEIHLGANPFLRQNNLRNKFESTDIYLDTHFRLLREDFVRPLRNGIQEILQHNDRSIHKAKFDDIRLYFKTRLVSPMCTSSGIVYTVQFDVTPLKWIRWQNSKRLLYGSLVCLSQDNFETFLFATVSNRDAKDLEKGKVQLQFCEQSRELLARARPADLFVMVETTAYFEAYRHVLEGLKEMNARDVPFQKYIVSCEKDVRVPQYLNARIPYDLTCMMIEEKKAKLASRNKINILNAHQWPSKEDLGFDVSQIEAVRLALTKELAIIQGPPGTGKTYIGLKIAEALLTNTNVWQLDGPRPILVVCFTNHALDQFLEGIHQFLRSGIVRVGGRSNSEVLKQFNVRELRQTFRTRRNYSVHIRRAFGEVTEEMKLAEQKLQEGGQLLECTTAGIIHERFLQKHIQNQHWESLQMVMDDEEYFIPTRGSKSKIVEWLGLGESHFVHSADAATEGDLPGAQADFEELDEEEPEEEKLVEIQEEADLIQEERELDDEDEEETVKSKKRKAKIEESGIARLLLAMSLNDKEAEESPDNEGQWQTTSEQKKKRKKRMKSELKRTDAMTEAEADQIVDLWRLDLNARWKLYRYWIQLYQQDIRLKILTHEEKYQQLADRLSELRERQDLEILQQAKVIGMTTTGAAKYRRILLEVQPCIVIVEEAAEVLEAHTITTLSAQCQHLILIGDHQQLRPSANVYDLAKNFNLEVSLFERLIESQLPYVRLDYQHRMRPEIARLLTPHIYSQLENHPSVLKYENIKGVSSNLFFVKHNFREEEIKDGKSHQNIHEARFVVELCKYLLNQEYKPSQITILTTYTGQLFCLRKLMPAQTFSGVKVHVVDKYQGEENDIVLLSLVRSNKDGRVGFLKIANRICVALSRAKKGLYCIGNMDMLSAVPLWSHIIGTLKQNGQVGDHLMLYCQNHPETCNRVKCAEDFQKVPEGGCNRECETRLECGHVCTRACHTYDQEHKEYQCNKECPKSCTEGHTCTRKCYQPCGECMVKVEKMLPSCGHLQMVPCSVSEDTYCCPQPCEKTLACGHKCPKCCGDNCEVRCPQEISATLKCGHRQKIKCWQGADLESGKSIRCNNPCKALLSCGHQCFGSCDGCFQGRFHKGCKHPCKATLVCSHECQQPCTRVCPPCRRVCQNRCVHSQCKKKCGESCVPCRELCNWSCVHYQCTRLCSEPCDRPPCDVPCTKQLKCGHQCIGLCGEPCPKKCRTCDKDEVTEIFFGFEEDDDACFVQLEDCGHILESKGMDTYMEVQGNPEEGSAIKLKECPRCKTPIRRNLRYGTTINKTLSEIEKVKERILGPASAKDQTITRLNASLQQMINFRRNFPDEYAGLVEKLDNPATQLRTLNDLENVMSFYERLAKLFGNISKADAEDRFPLKERLQQIKKWLEKPRSFLSEQELSDLQTEVARFAYLLQLLVKCKEAKVRITAVLQREITFLRDVLESNKPFTKDDEKLVKTKLKELNKTLPNEGLGITDDERVSIVQAMGLTKGHWFKCPNNHIYCITECGGAMEESKCPECKANIGGTQHRLLSTNRLASEMDGAQHAAWSDVANDMMNFQDFRD